MGLKKIRALTLLEIVVALVILSLTMLGMVNVFVSAKQHVQHTRARMGGMQLGKTFLDPLQESVRWDTWNLTGSNQLALTGGNVNGSSLTFGNLTFTPAYNVTDASVVAGYPPLRKVRVQVSWTERGLPP